LLSESGSKLITKTLKALETGTAPKEKQDEALSSYASMMDKKMSEIDWTMSCMDVHNRIRGFNPWPVAYSTYDGTRIKIYKSEVLEKTSEKAPGTILHVSSKGMEVATGDKVIGILEIQVPGSKKMAVKDYILGHTLETGKILGE